MGSRQSTVDGEESYSLDKAKDKEALQKSREKYLEHVLDVGEENQDENDGNGDYDSSDDKTSAETDTALLHQDLQDGAMTKKETTGACQHLKNKSLKCQRCLQRRLHVPKVLPGNPNFYPRGVYERSSSFEDEEDVMAASVEPRDYCFPFENLIFEGGGNKGLAYCGAVRYLEEVGMMKKVTRLAGTSAGSMMAALLAVGYTSHEIEQFLSDRIESVFMDASCGYFSLLPNLLTRFGWNPGVRITEWFQEKLGNKTGLPDITFRQMHEELGKELCVVVTNLSQMTTEYCHLKTTPDMPVRMAIRMSMAMPGLFSAIKYKHHGTESLYVDGGLLCNYPIHCFDGWFLSLKAEDSFVQRLQPLSAIPYLMERNNRFGTHNPKTLGMLLYSDKEEDMLRMNLEKRVGVLDPPEPRVKTKLFKKRLKELQKKRKTEREHARVVEAVDSFLRVLKKHNIDDNDVIDIHELEAAFQDVREFPREQAEVLFGTEFTVCDAFDVLDKDCNGQIHFDELMRFIEENGVSLQNRFQGYQKKVITNFASFLDTLQDTLAFNVKKLYVQEHDLDRTVGINTGHVEATDFNLEDADRDFIVERGYNSMRAFLQYYVVRNPNSVWKRTTARQDTSVAEPPDGSKNETGKTQNEAVKTQNKARKTQNEAAETQNETEETVDRSEEQ